MNERLKFSKTQDIKQHRSVEVAQKDQDQPANNKKKSQVAQKLNANKQPRHLDDFEDELFDYVKNMPKTNGDIQKTLNNH